MSTTTTTRCRPDCCCPLCDSEMATLLILDSEQESKFMAHKTAKLMAAAGKDPREIEAHQRWMRGQLTSSQRAAVATSAGPRTACPGQPADATVEYINASIQVALNPPDSWGVDASKPVAAAANNYGQRGFPLGSGTDNDNDIYLNPKNGWDVGSAAAPAANSWDTAPSPTSNPWPTASTMTRAERDAAIETALNPPSGW